jgi:hypothetical protein
MINILEDEQLKVMYYKTSVSKEEFHKYINEHLCDFKKFECKITNHSSGLFFEKKRKNSVLFLNSVQIVFSQRQNYSLICIPKI